MTYPELAPNCKLVTKAADDFGIALNCGDGQLIEVVGRGNGDDDRQFLPIVAAIQMAAWDDYFWSPDCHSEKGIEHAGAQLDAWTEIWRECQKAVKP